MPNQRSNNQIEALKEWFQSETKAAEDLMAKTQKEFEEKLKSLTPKPLEAAIKAQQTEIIAEIATLQTGIEEHDAKIAKFKKKKKALQKRIEAEQAPKHLLESKLKTQQGKLAKLPVEEETSLYYDNPIVEPDLDNITQLPEHTDEGARSLEYHVSAPSTDAGPDWAERNRPNPYNDPRGNRAN